MEDIYYVTSAELELLEIAKCLEGSFRRELIQEGESQDLIVYFDEDDCYCRWWKRLEVDEVLSELEDDEREELLSLDPSSVFLITFHPSTHLYLKPMFMKILSRYDGFVGCKDWYSVGDIDQFDCT